MVDKSCDLDSSLLAEEKDEAADMPLLHLGTHDLTLDEISLYAKSSRFCSRSKKAQASMIRPVWSGIYSSCHLNI